MNKLKQIALWTVIIGYFPITLSFVTSARDEVVCEKVVADICDSLKSQFIVSDEIEQKLIKQFPDVLGYSLNEINCNKIENYLLKHPAVEECNVFPTMGGALKVVINQRIPILRIFEKSKSYYIDRKGHVMPLFSNYSAHVLVASGHLNKVEDINLLIEFAQYINNDAFWKAQIEQIYIESNGDVTLVPRVGDQIIILGALEKYKISMRNLMALYTNGIKPQEWNKYKEINLKYNGQIVCSKK